MQNIKNTDQLYDFFLDKEKDLSDSDTKVNEYSIYLDKKRLSLINIRAPNNRSEETINSIAKGDLEQTALQNGDMLPIRSAIDPPINNGQTYYNTIQKVYKVCINDSWQIVATQNINNWTNASLINGWTNFGSVYSTAAYYIDQFKIVHLKGLINNGTIGLVAFYLPLSLTPPTDLIISTASNNAYGQVIIDASTGGVIAHLGSNVWFSLENISFRVN